jgi:hypothetical protein
MSDRAADMAALRNRNAGVDLRQHFASGDVVTITNDSDRPDIDGIRRTEPHGVTVLVVTQTAMVVVNHALMEREGVTQPVCVPRWRVVLPTDIK